MFDMGKRICKLRRDAHLSQKQLGEKIGKSASTIGSYENDTAVPTLENAAALAEALHVSLDYLLYGEKSRTLPLQKMSENRVQLLTDLAQEFAAPTSHGAAFSDLQRDLLRRLCQEFYRQKYWLLGFSSSVGVKHAFAFTHDFLSLAQVL